MRRRHPANGTVGRVTDTGTCACSAGERKVGDQVNLERAMGAHVRFGGHFVQVRCSGWAAVERALADVDDLE